MSLLQFEPFETVIVPGFWLELGKKKLEKIGLNQDLIPLKGYYEAGQNESSQPPKFYLDSDSFDPSAFPAKASLKGELKLFNTLDEFKQFDKAGWLQEMALNVDQDYFFMIAFADLKKYKYYYHLCLPSPFSTSTPITVELVDDGSCNLIEAPIMIDASSRDGFVVGWNIRYFIIKNQAKYIRLIRKNCEIVYKVMSCPDLGAHQLQWSGWERNTQGKIGPRMVDLSSTLDPSKVAEESAMLNLKLIKWRLMPDLNLDLHRNSKCLLIGAGTLGCNVTRCLLAWGFNHITLIDNGRVSYSNPVRQSLFIQEDCLNGGKPKAITAAKRAKEICPYASIQGIQLNIPMPGHLIVDHEEFLKEAETIIELVQSHDVIFLLTDSRESRWLPALLGAVYGKAVLTVALGFDSFVVMRHGTDKNQLGCYFCHDVNSPADTLTGRTLDQQCTVTRPGLSYSASGTAVELLASILQHPDQIDVPQMSAAHPTELLPPNASMLGLVPHQIRGFLSHHQNLILTGQRFSCCPACSPSVIKAYHDLGLQFLERAISEPDYLETVSGLAQLRNQSEDLLIEALDLDDEDDF